MTEIEDLEAKIDGQQEEYLKSGYDDKKKLEALQLLKDYIIQYLSLIRHADKFKFPSISKVLEQSVSKYGSDFKPFEAGAAFEHLSKYAQNLIEEPWREEYKIVKLCSGFYVHKISGYLVNAQEILVLMGYEQISETDFKFKPTLTTSAEFEKLKRISRDLLVCSLECIIIGNIFEVLRNELPYTFPSIDNVFLYRQHYTGDVYTIAKIILDQINSNSKNQSTPIDTQNDTRPRPDNKPHFKINNTQNESQNCTANNGDNYSAFSCNENKNYQSEYPPLPPPALVKTQVSAEDIARRLTTNTPTSAHRLSFGIGDMENKLWSVPKAGTKSTVEIEMDAERIYSEAVEYNSKVNEPFLRNSQRRQLVNACTSTTCDKKDTTIQSQSKCDGSKSMAMETNSADEADQNLDYFYYNSIISRSKVPGFEAEIERVPLSYLNNKDTKSLRFPEPIHRIPEKQTKLSNNEENRQLESPTIDRFDKWPCSHCTFVNYTFRDFCGVCGERK